MRDIKSGNVERPQHSQNTKVGKMDRDTRVGSGRKVTIGDVARAAGVSKYVAYDAFTRPERMHPDRVDAIRTAAAELGYERRRYVKRPEEQTYGFLLPRMADGATEYHEIYATMGVALVEAALRADAQMLVFGYDPEGGAEDPEVQALRAFLARPGVEGVVITDGRAPGTDPRLDWLLENDVPFVMLGRGDDSYCWVDMDDQRAAEELTGRLVDAGHRRIGRVGFAHDGTGPPVRRQEGYERIVGRGLLSPTELESLTIRLDYGDRRDDELASRLAALVAQGAPGGPVTAFFCDSDKLAISVQRLLLRHFRESGVADPLRLLPEVVGIDNTQARRENPIPFASAGQDWKRYADRTIAMLQARRARPGFTDFELLHYDIHGTIAGPAST